jgi:hypothetical protein
MTTTRRGFRYDRGNSKLEVVVDGKVVAKFNDISPALNVPSLTLDSALPVASGGSGATSLTDGGILLGSGTSAVTAMAVLADGAIVVGDGNTDPVALAAFSSSTGALKVANGGTGASSLADKAVLITQDSGTDTVAAVAMDANGELLIGGTSGPAVATITAGTNITITNGNGAITIAQTSAGVGLGLVIALS